MSALIIRPPLRDAGPWRGPTRRQWLQRFALHCDARLPRRGTLCGRAPGHVGNHRSRDIMEDEANRRRSPLARRPSDRVGY